MPKFNDLTGNRYGMLTVIERVANKGVNYYQSGYTTYLCKCDCGNEKDILAKNLVKGLTKSCGCLRSKSSKINSQKAREKRLEDIKKYGGKYGL